MASLQLSKARARDFSKQADLKHYEARKHVNANKLSKREQLKLWYLGPILLSELWYLAKGMASTVIRVLK